MRALQISWAPTDTGHIMASNRSEQTFYCMWADSDLESMVIVQSVSKLHEYSFLCMRMDDEWGKIIPKHMVFQGGLCKDVQDGNVTFIWLEYIFCNILFKKGKGDIFTVFKYLKFSVAISNKSRLAGWPKSGAFKTLCLH